MYGEGFDCSAQEMRKSSNAPILIGQVEFRANLVILPDGSWEVYTARDYSGVFKLDRICSNDEGVSWSESEVLRELPGDGWAGAVSLLDSDNEVHLIFSKWRHREGRKPAVDRFIDLWHLHSKNSRAVWTEPQLIFEGYVGSIQCAVQLRSGRIVLPFAYWVGGLPSAPPTGSNITTTVFSDDGGMTWKQSAAKLTAPCYFGYNGNNYGAVEPAIMELKDGRVWMLVRTQTGFLHESFSRDGEHWSELMPSRFHSSSSPAYLLRLPDNHIVLFWNNCQKPSRVNGDGVYAGRDQMHAAISDDEGVTWRGYREVYLDPARNNTPPKRGDRGTAYPHAVTSRDGKIALVTGQGQGRLGQIMVDPGWLLETHHADDFSGGLDSWSVFKSFGPAKGWWQDRTQGPQLIDHPVRQGARVLHIRRPDKKPGDGAVWNFPAGKKGRLTMNIMLREGFSGANIALNDRFFNPTDNNGEKEAMFCLSINEQCRLPDNTELAPERFYMLELEWDVGKRHCDLFVDGKEISGLPLLNDTIAGVCYLRLRSTASSKDTAGMLIESVAVKLKTVK